MNTAPAAKHDSRAIVGIPAACSQGHDRKDAVLHRRRSAPTVQTTRRYDLAARYVQPGRGSAPARHIVRPGAFPVFRPRPIGLSCPAFACDVQSRRAIRNIDIACRCYNNRGVFDFDQPQHSGGLYEAVAVLEKAQHVWLSTGFNVAENMPETDGPAGLAALGFSLAACGKKVSFICDSLNLPLVLAALQVLDSQAGEPYTFVVMDEKDDLAPAFARKLFADAPCDACLALELTGRNIHGQRLNMRGVDITGFNAAVDEVMNQANALGIPTIAVGDGGNEAGTGGTANVPLATNGKDMAAAIAAQSQVYAWNSNLGGLALAEILLARQGKSAHAVTATQLTKMVAATMEKGAVDGCTRSNQPGQDSFVDGFGFSTHETFLDMLKRLAQGITPVAVDFVQGGAK